MFIEKDADNVEIGEDFLLIYLDSSKNIPSLKRFVFRIFKNNQVKIIIITFPKKTLYPSD